MISISEQQLELFISLFRGRTDVYARRWEKEGRSGYSPAYDFNWDEFMAHKRRCQRSILGAKLVTRADKGQQRFTFWLGGGRSCKTWQLS